MNLYVLTWTFCTNMEKYVNMDKDRSWKVRRRRSSPAGPISPPSCSPTVPQRPGSQRVRLPQQNYSLIDWVRGRGADMQSTCATLSASLQANMLTSD